MALINCPECNHEMSDTVKKCPNCGFRIKNPEQAKKTRNTRNTIIIIVGLIVIICGIIGVIMAVKRDNAYWSEDGESVAILQAKSAVRDRLKAPSTAQFSRMSAEKITTGKNSGCYRVTGDVDSQNSYGAMIRNSFTVIIEGNKVLSVEFK